MNLSVHFDSTRSTPPVASTPPASGTSFAETISSTTENQYGSSTAEKQTWKPGASNEPVGLQSDKAALTKLSKTSAPAVTVLAKREGSPDKKSTAAKTTSQAFASVATVEPTPAPKIPPVTLAQLTADKPAPDPNALGTLPASQPETPLQTVSTSTSEGSQQTSVGQVTSIPVTSPVVNVKSEAKPAPEQTEDAGSPDDATEEIATEKSDSDRPDAKAVANGDPAVTGAADAATALPQANGFVVPQWIVAGDTNTQTKVSTSPQTSVDAVGAKTDLAAGKVSGNATSSVSKQKAPAAGSATASTPVDGTQPSSLAALAKDNFGNPNPQHQGSGTDAAQPSVTSIPHADAGSKPADLPSTSPAAADASAATRTQSQTLDVDAASAKTVTNTSQLIQTMHQSEMRVGMNSAEFGAISISTSISHQVLSASISLGHAELSSALASHMPAIQEKLSNAYGLQTRVELKDAGNAGQQGTAQQSRQGQHGSRSSQGSSGATAISQASGVTDLPAALTTSSAASSMRLDVLY